MNPAHFAERHQQDVVISETDDFGECASVVSCGFDTADFAERGERAFGFDDESDDLYHATTVLEDAGFPCTLEGVRQTMTGTDGSSP
jgi:hypothetical protein